MKLKPLLIAVCLVVLGLGSVGLAAPLDEPLDVDRALSGLGAVEGRTITRLEIEGQVPVEGNTNETFRRLQGKPLNLNEVKESLRWFVEANKDAAVEFLATKTSAGVEITVKIQLKQKIEQILFPGAHSFEPNDLLTVAGIQIGDDLDANSVETAVRKLLDFYQNAGFLQAKIKHEVFMNGVLNFNVEEGNAATIRSIQFSEMTNVKDPKIRRLLESSAQESFGVKAGERLDRRKIKEGIGKLKEWLRGHDFVIAREPVVNSVIFDGGNSAKLDVSILYGPRIKFGFRNNKRFSFKELSSFVAEIQEVGISTDYLDAVRSRILRAYQEVGLVNLKIDTEVRDDSRTGYRHVSFILNEGERIRIESISIEGIYSMEQQEAVDRFLSFAPALVQRYFFQDSGIRAAGELLANDLRSRGYLSARLDLVKYRFNEKRTKVDIDLYFMEGIQTIVQTVRIDGSDKVSPQEIKSMLGLEEGKPFNVFEFEKGLTQVKERYRSLGYLTMEFKDEGTNSVAQYSKDQSAVDIDLQVNEGPLIRVGDIVVRGNKKTHTKVITRELTFNRGDILTSDVQVESEENLRRLNLFTSVILRPVERPSAPDIRDIIILVEEGTPGLIELGPGYRNDLGLRFFTGASYQNLGGWHRGVTASTVVNRRLENFKFLEYNVSLGFREPYFAGIPVTLFTNVFFLRRIFNSFDATISKATAEFRKVLTKRITGLLQYSFEQVKTYNARIARDNQKRLIGAVTPGIIFDSRNNVFNPTRGIFSVNRVEFASKVFGSQPDVGYWRATTNNTAYVSLTEDLVLGFAVNIGFERSNLPGKEIPKIKLFRLGGTSSIRGYREEALEVDSTTIINGTLSLTNYRSELRFPIEGDLGGAIFWDAGNLFVDTIKPFSLRHSSGFGLRYKTPVGPVSLDYARKLGSIGPRGDGVNTQDLDDYRVHFSIGNF